MNEKLRGLTLINFKGILNNLKGNDLKDALKNIAETWAFHNWIGDALFEACEELNLDFYEIQETQEYMDGFYDEDCYDYIDELKGE